jgi:hypothetical protein
MSENLNSRLSRKALPPLQNTQLHATSTIDDDRTEPLGERVRAFQQSGAFAVFESDRSPQFLAVDLQSGTFAEQLRHQVDQAVGDGVELVLDRIIGSFLGVLQQRDNRNVTMLMISCQVSILSSNRKDGAQASISSTQKAKYPARETRASARVAKRSNSDNRPRISASGRLSRPPIIGSDVRPGRWATRRSPGIGARRRDAVRVGR